MDSKNNLINEFHRIKGLGWIEVDRKRADNYLGNTFEDLMGIQENNLPSADYDDIEIKAHRINSNSLITLFTKSPTYPPMANTFLRINFGVDENGNGIKELHTTINGLQENTFKGLFSFQVIINETKQKVFLRVRNLKTNEIDSNEIYWDYEELKKAIAEKIKNLAVVYAEEKNENGKNYVRYIKLVIVSGLTIQKLIDAISKGDLFIDLRIGAYKSGPNIGKTHDHGTGFRMFLNDLIKTYDEVVEIE